MDHNLLRLAVVFAGVSVASIGCKPSPTPSPLTPDPPQQSAQTSVRSADVPRFRDVANQSGVRFIYENGQQTGQASILESLGGGVAMLDYDNDKLLDLCFTGGGIIDNDLRTSPAPTGLFRNLGDWLFESVANDSNVQSAKHYSHGAHAGDFDNDGFCDLLITAYGGLQLWRNQGDGTFQEIQEQAGLLDKSWSTSAAWGDLNGDSYLDLYVAHYVDWSAENHPFWPGPLPQQREICPPRDFDALPDIVYLNNGDGTFRDATLEVGLDQKYFDITAAKGLGTLICDFDQDGDVDVYVANDTTENYLFLNDGRGHFQEIGQLHGVALDEVGVPNGSMGIDAMDYNLDGQIDLWVANYERESFALYRNEGNGQFLHVSQGAGISALGGVFVGFGTASFDIDHDADEDLIVANGHVLKFPRVAPRRQLPLILLNERSRFRRLEFLASDYFGQPHEGRGLAVGDLDNDGDLDVAISHIREPVAVLERHDPIDSHWLIVKLIGVSSNRDAVGARLILHTSLGDRLRQIKGGGSYLSQSDLRVHWGLPQGATAQALTVYWHGGHVQRVEPVALDRQLDVIESSGTSKPPAASGGQE